MSPQFFTKITEYFFIKFVKLIYFTIIYNLFVIPGMVDSNWNIGALLEKKLQPLPFTFALSGMANQSKQQFKFGCGLIIG